MKILIAIVWAFAFTAVAFAAAPTDSKLSVKKTGKNSMSFDNQLVEGEIYRPDYSVVTGEAPGEGWGLLRLRDSFDDHRATDDAEKQEHKK